MTAAATHGPRARLLALMFFFCVPALLFTLSILNVLEIEDNSFVEAEKEFQLSSLMRRLTAPAKDGKPTDLSQIYLSSASATLAGADLQQYLTETIAKGSGKLIETAILESDREDEQSAQNLVSIRASSEIDNNGLLSVLHRLETGLPLVFIDKISIRRLGGDDTSPGAEALRVDLEVSARWKATVP